MKPFRVSIVGLMAVVLVVAVGVAALRSATGLWAGAVFTLALGAPAIATLGAVYRRGPRRASWAGFAAFGWGYLLLGFGPGFETTTRPRLLTTKLLDVLYARMNPAPQSPTYPWTVRSIPTVEQVNSSTIVLQEISTAGTSDVTRWIPAPPALTPGPSRESFHDIGHALAALLAAFLGSQTALLFAARGDAEGTRHDRGSDGG